MTVALTFPSVFNSPLSNLTQIAGNSTISPSFAHNFSTFNNLPGSALYCFPPVFTIA